ncbi:MAG: GNAT family N-acetyltransferase [Candidatus Rokuibacteriota bacterium]|nr:MAG: GNAT family N-acetyltransferase [Candidatus Rokubacteria bacterium]
MIVIRPCRVAECPAVLALWQRAGAIPSPTDTLVELEQLIAHQGDGLLVAVEDGVIVGSVIGGWDGWRGNIYRLAVAPEARRHGLARRLVDDAVRVLRARGAHRISALVERHEAHAVGFWDSLTDQGWRRDERMLRYIKNVDG